MSIFRQYTKDNSFLKFANVHQTIPSLTEYQIALAFARDYDMDGKPTNGEFTPYWHTEQVTADSIIKFKEKNPKLNKVDVFISIGDRDANFPFKPSNKDSWVSNATESIKSIIDKYFKPLKEIVSISIGLDVYYEHIDDEDDFPVCIGKLIKSLKEANVISLASIATSFKVLNDYVRLYEKYRDDIDFVVYQFHDEVDPISKPLRLVKRYEAIAQLFLPKSKILLGYSSVREDWVNLAPIVFFVGANLILLAGLSPGASIWDIESASASASADWALLPFGITFDLKLYKSA